MVEERAAAGRMIAAGMLLGTLGIFVEKAGLDSLSATFYRCVLGGAFLAMYWRWTATSATPRPSWRALSLATASGVLMAGNWVLFFEALARCGIAVATLVFHVQPILVVLLGAALLGERLTVRDGLWAVLAFVGLALTLVEQASTATQDLSYWLGIGAALAAALCYAGVTLMARALTSVPPALTATIQCVVGAILLAAPTTVSPGSLDTAQWLWLAGLGAIHTGLVYVLIYSALPKLSTATIAVLLFVYPVSAVVVDFIVYSRPLSALQAAGLGLVLLSAWGAVRRA